MMMNGVMLVKMAKLVFTCINNLNIVDSDLFLCKGGLQCQEKHQVGYALDLKIFFHKCFLTK